MANKIDIIAAVVRKIAENYTNGPDKESLLNSVKDLEYQHSIVDSFSPENPEKLAAAFVRLNSEGMDPIHCNELYLGLITTKDSPEMLATLFVRLNSEGMDPIHCNELYQELITTKDSPEMLAALFVSLKQNHFLFHENKSLYKTITKQKASLKEIYDVVIALGKAQVFGKENEKYYWFFMSNTSSNIEDLIDLLAILDEKGISIISHPKLFEECYYMVSKKERLFNLFAMLENAGANVQEHAELFESTIQKEQLSAYIFSNKTLIDAKGKKDPLPQILDALKNIGADFNRHIAIYKEAIAPTISVKSLSKALNALQDIQANLDEHEALYITAIRQSEYADQFPKFFEDLKQLGANLEEHGEIYRLGIQKLYLNNLKNNNLINDYSAASLGDILKLLHQMGARLKDDQEIFKGIISNYRQVEKILEAFNVLLSSGFRLQDNKSVFETIINHPEKAFELANTFLELSKMDISPAERPGLYEFTSQHIEQAFKLPKLYYALMQAGLPFSKYETIYQAAIINLDASNMLPILINILKEEGIHPEDHLQLYEKVVSHMSSIDYLKTVVTELKSRGINADEHPDIYLLLIENQSVPSFLSKVLDCLKTTGLSHEENKELFKSMLAMMKNWPKDIEIIELLYVSGLNPEQHLRLYKAALVNSIDTMSSDLILSRLRMINGFGATVNEHFHIYEKIIENSNNYSRHNPSWKWLESEGILFQRHSDIYLAALETPSSYQFDLMEILKIFRENALSADDYPELFLLAIQQINQQSFSCLEALKHFNLLNAEHAEIVKKTLFYGSEAIDLLLWLEKNHFSITSHPFIYQEFFLKENAFYLSRYRISHIKLKIEDYLKEHELCSPENEGYQAQNQKIMDIMDEVKSIENELSEGPLNKSQETLTLETILKRIIAEGFDNIHKRIIAEGIDNIQMSFDKALGYILQFGDEPEIYLTELLRLVNFNHIELSNEEVEAIGLILKSIPVVLEELPILEANIIVKTLPEAARYELNRYVANKYYMNINRLFRGVAQTNDIEHTWMTPVEGKSNLIANFLSGCLINWAAAELPRILSHSEERQLIEKILKTEEEDFNEVIKEVSENEAVFLERLQKQRAEERISQEDYEKASLLFNELKGLFPNYGLIDRGENLNEAQNNGEMAITARRQANPVITPSVMSLSVFKDGASWFDHEDLTRTKIETDNSTRTVINAYEGEILVPMGTSYQYTANSSGGFFAREVNSPGITPGGDKWSSTAIAEAYRHHLKNPYKDKIDQVVIDDKVVQRPNHGLAHVYRTMIYVDIVIDYFAKHANDETFKLFCRYISCEERQWLRVAAVFSITGRESEISAAENLTRYNEFREASMQHLAAFLKKYPPASENEAMHERMLHLVRWLGNPAYENSFKDQEKINDHEDENERLNRNFIHRILTIAHKLDLVRCYPADQFNHSMEICRSLSQSNDEQYIDYTGMIQYAVDLCNAHGDCLCTSISADKELINTHENYRSPFGLVSTNLRQLREMTETVKRPQLSEQYQFDVSEDSPFVAKPSNGIDNQ